MAHGPSTPHAKPVTSFQGEMLRMLTPGRSARVAARRTRRLSGLAASVRVFSSPAPRPMAFCQESGGAEVECGRRRAGRGADDRRAARAGEAWDFAVCGGSLQPYDRDAAAVFSLTAPETLTALGVLRLRPEASLALYACSDAACDGTGELLATTVIGRGLSYRIGHFEFPPLSTPITLLPGAHRSRTSHFPSPPSTDGRVRVPRLLRCVNPRRSLPLRRASNDRDGFIATQHRRADLRPIRAKPPSNRGVLHRTMNGVPRLEPQVTFGEGILDGEKIGCQRGRPPSLTRR